MADFKKDLQNLKVNEFKASKVKEWQNQANKDSDTRLCGRCGGCGGCGRCGCGGCGGCFGCFFCFI